MTKEVRAKTFKSGNSVALRLPKVLGIKEGVEMTVREEQGKYVVEPVDMPKKRIDLSGIYGAGAGLRPLRPQDRLMEPRKLDWSGKLVRRD